MEYAKPYLLNIFTFNNLHGYFVEIPIQTLIIQRHIVFLMWFIKRAWAACENTECGKHGFWWKMQCLYRKHRFVFFPAKI